MRTFNTGPLAGVKVVDLTSIGMGPLATQLLGDMGADVIKIESAEGDAFRHVHPMRHPGMSHAALNFNRNKRSAVLDLKQADDMQVLQSLIAKADVFVSNVRPDALARLGLDAATLCARHPCLIHCTCHGYSQHGPYRGRPSVDDVIQAASGAAWLQGWGGDAPRYVNTVMADKVCGMSVCNAVTMALYEREKSGLGQSIEIPMFETMVAFLAPEHLAGLTFVPPQGAAGYSRVLSEFRRPCRSADGWIAIVPYTDAQWRRFFELCGRPDLGADPRFATTLDRSEHIDTLYETLGAITRTRTNAQWTALLEAADIPFSSVNSFEDLTRDPHLEAVGFWQRVRHPTEGDLLMPGIPVHYSRTPGSIRRHAPGLGEHTHEVKALAQDRSWITESTPE